MNKKLSAAIMTLWVLSLISGSTGDALAQARKAGTGGAGAAAPAAPAAGRESVIVKKVELVKIKTPDYNNNLNESSLTTGDWARVLVRFDAEAEWTDQLEMQFYIVLKHPKTGAYTMFTGTFFYADIPKGRGRQVAVFLRPRTTERYGAPEQAAVVIKSRGEEVATGSFPESNKAWWRTATVRSIEGYIFDRSQTPFANIASDNYETLKGK
jgi:hypothetical protein